MPLMWRYLLFNYLKVFLLSAASFIAILLTLRLEEIVYFATLGSEGTKVLWFVFQQIPYILPIAIPVSGLISSVLLMQSLSQSKELTAIRSSGFRLTDILAPILAMALLLSCLNFYIISELSTRSHLAAGQFKNQLRSVNPLLILNNSLLMKIKGFYFDALGTSRVGEFAEDLIFLTPSRHSDRLALMITKKLTVSSQFLIGDSVTFITSHQKKIKTHLMNRELLPYEDQQEPHFDHLVIENMRLNKTTIQDFSQLARKKINSINHDHLPMRQLLVRKDVMREKLDSALLSNRSVDEVNQARHDYYRSLSEIFRRLSASFAVFTFTLIGLAFGMSISRNTSNMRLFYVTLLASIYLIAFFTAKSFDQDLGLSVTLYLAPHLLIFCASLRAIRKISRGIE